MSDSKDDDELIKLDGVWRPQRWLNGRWMVARYVRMRDSVMRDVDEQLLRRGKRIVRYYDTLPMAQARAKTLNEEALKELRRRIE